MDTKYFHIFNIHKYHNLYLWDRQNRDQDKWYWSLENIFQYLSGSPYNPWDAIETMTLTAYFQSLNKIKALYKEARENENRIAGIVWERNAAKALAAYVAEQAKEMRNFKPTADDNVVKRLRYLEFQLGHVVFNGNHVRDDPEYKEALRALEDVKARYESYIADFEMAAIRLIIKPLTPSTRKYLLSLHV